MSYNIGIYIRISKEDNNKNNSIENQKNIIISYINNKLYNLKYSNIKYYIDNGFSGTNFNRDGIKLLLDHIKNNQIQCIIVKDFSRFGRNYVEVCEYIEKIFPFLNIRFISINDNYDSNFKNSNNIDVSLKNVIYSYYSKDLSKKVKSSLITKAKNGEYIYAIPPFGYEKSRVNKNKLKINEYEAKIVKQIFNLSISGKTTIEIARILNNKNIKTRKCHISNNTSTKSFWTSSSILSILSNEIYLGKTIYFRNKVSSIGSKKLIKNNKENWLIINNTHAPIISDQDFRNTNIKKKFIKGKYNNKNNLFAYKLKCANCNYALYFHKNTKEKYSCKTSKYTNYYNCFNGYIFKNKLEEIICIILKKYFFIKDYFSFYENKINYLKKRLLDINDRKYYFYELYVEDVICKKDYEYKISILNNSKTEILDQIYKLKINNFFEYIINKNLNFKIINLLLSKIYVFNEKNIKIVFKFKEL